MQKHQTTMHNFKDKLNERMGKKFFQCAFCPHVFRQKYQLKNHEHASHLLVSEAEFLSDNLLIESFSLEEASGKN